MAQYPKITLTNSGLNMIAESQGGTALVFTKMIMGDGELLSGEDIKALTNVKNAMLTVPLQGFESQGEGQVRLRFTVSNSTLETGFFAREIGVYAKLGQSGVEQLYAYTNAGNKTDYMPDKSVPLDSQILDLYLIVGNASSVSAILDGNASYATKLDLAEHNASETAHEDIRTAINNAGLNLLKRNKTYAIGDIAYSANLPSWARLECVKAGTTAAIEPTFANITQAGVLVTDGTVTWIVDDVRDCTPVGAVTGRMYLPAGYVKANGATVNRADYPRLVTLADRYSFLWTDTPDTYPGLFGKGNGTTTMVLPDWRGVVKRYLDDGKGYDAGRVLGTHQEDMFKNHNHNLKANTNGNFGSGGDTYYIGGGSMITTGSYITYTGGTETRMKNISEIAVIKY